MMDFTVAVISDNTGIVTFTPIKYCDTVFHAILVFRQLKKTLFDWIDFRLKENTISYLNSMLLFRVMS